MQGERGDVDGKVVNDWKEKLPQLIKDYEPCDVYNMDETGLFYRATSKQTYKEKGKECVGGKFSKERLTIALCANMAGEKEPAFVIGKAYRPRCFQRKKIDPNNLPVRYAANKKAWMTGASFESWLIQFDKKMKKKNRYVILFLDNAPSHPKVKLGNVKLQFFPPNTTSLVQPMDQGIIQSMKLQYRKKQMGHLLCQMEKKQRLKWPSFIKTNNCIRRYLLDSPCMDVSRSKNNPEMFFK
jgi:hypothetical protein